MSSVSSSPGHHGSLHDAVEVVPTVAQQRRTLVVVGSIVTLAGLLSLLSPWFSMDFAFRLLGYSLIMIAMLHTLQWLLGRFWTGDGGRCGSGIIAIASLNLGLGIAFAFYDRLTIAVVVVILVMLLVLEGFFLLTAAYFLSQRRSAIAVAVCGGVSLAVGIGSLFFLFEPAQMRWLFRIVGVKLLVFGGTLIYVGAFTSVEQAYVIFGAATKPRGKGVPGEVYAVLFGPAFHCGVCIDEDTVVDYRDDNKVHRVSWDDFSLGRPAQNWTYPDLPEIPASEVIQTAEQLVGKEYPYHGFKSNCETFAIYCKSGRRTHTSQFAQVALGVETLSRNPLLGSTLEFFCRLLGYAAYLGGGTFGKQVGFYMRWIAARVANWMALRASKDGDREFTDFGLLGR